MPRFSLIKIIQTLIIVVLLIFAFKYFQSTPFEKTFFQLHAVYLALILLLLGISFLNALMKRRHYNKIEVYYLFLITTVPLYSAYRSYTEFGQPFIYGLLSERGWITLGLGLCFYYTIRSKKVNYKEYESAFILLAWSSLLVFAWFYFFFDPSQLTTDSAFVLNSAERGIRFKFTSYFITFGSIYYYVRHFHYSNYKDLYKALCFLCYIIFLVQGRTYTFAIAITLIIYSLSANSSRKKIFAILKIAAIVIATALTIYLFAPNYFGLTIDLFTQMFQVLGGKESQDVSANARLYESQTVLSYFRSNPSSIFFGTGNISNQWNEGYKSLFGYFYPADIGILGGVFVYGVLGLFFILAIPLFLTFKILFMKLYTDSCFLVSLKYLLIFNIVTLLQGNYFFNPIAYIVPLFLLLGFYYLDRNNGIYNARIKSSTATK
jgi:hypothetical protein